MSANSTDGRRLLDAFVAAIQTGDIAALVDGPAARRRRAAA